MAVETSIIYLAGCIVSRKIGMLFPTGMALPDFDEGKEFPHEPDFRKRTVRFKRPAVWRGAFDQEVPGISRQLHRFRSKGKVYRDFQ
jgi:hypothetical protein